MRNDRVIFAVHTLKRGDKQMKLTKISVIFLFICIFILSGCALKDTFVKKDKVVNDITFAEVKKGDLTVYTRDMGMVKAKNTITLYSKVSGKIESMIPDGTNAKKGDIIIKMDSTDFENNATDKKLSFDQEQANLIQALEELKVLEATAKLSIDAKIAQQQYDKTELEVAQKEYERTKKLYLEKIKTLQDVEQSESSVRSKKNTVKTDGININIERETQNSKIIQKKAQIELQKTKVKKTKIDYEKAKKQLEETVIKSPSAGLVVYKSTWKGESSQKYSEGDEVRNGEALIELPDLSALIVDIPLRESEINKVKMGQKVIVEFDGGKKLFFEGKVSYISKTGEAMTWRTTERGTPGQSQYPLTVEIVENKDKFLRPGMRLSCDIITDELKDVLYIPKQCVFYKEKKPFIWLEVDGKYKEQSVEIGKSNENYTEVKNLKEGAKVALKKPDLIHEENSPEKVEP